MINSIICINKALKEHMWRGKCVFGRWGDVSKLFVFKAESRKIMGEERMCGCFISENEQTIP